jgi:hypothetical protein
MKALKVLHILGVDMESEGLPLPRSVLYTLGPLVETDPRLFTELAAACLAMHRDGITARELIAYVKTTRYRQRFAMPASTLEATMTKET